MAKTAASQVNVANQYLPEFVSPSQDEYIKSLSANLRRLSELEQNPVTGRLKSPSQTGQSLAESRKEQADLKANIDSVYDKTFAASTQNRLRHTSARYTSPGAGIDPAVTAEENVEGLRRTDAATIGQDQGWARMILANTRHKPAEVFSDPELTYGEEERLLEAFAEQTGVDPKDIANSPSLRAEFGRYLGKATGTLNADVNYAYDLQGNERRDADGKTYKTPTPYVEPKIIDQYTNIDNTLASKDLAKSARTSKEKFIKDVMARGSQGLAPMDEAWAERMYDNISNTNFDESIINTLAEERKMEQARFGDTIKADDISNVSSRMANRQYKVFEGFMRSLRNYNSSPMLATRFTEKYLGGRFKEFSNESAEELVYTFMATHSALAEKRPDAARMWSDMMMLAVLDHTLRNVYRYEQKKKQAEGAEADETTEQAQDRFDETLMTGAADEAAIGSVIFKNMGFDGASRDQKAMLGAMAQSMVFETFRKEAPYTKGNRAQHEKALVKRIINKTGEGDSKRTNIAYTFTEVGLSVAEDFQGLFNAVMPQSTRDVRYGNKKTDQAAINKLINMPVAVKVDGTYEYQGYTVPFGNTTEAAAQKEQAENVPVTIHRPTSDFLNTLLEDFQESGFQLEYADDIENLLAILDNPKFYNTKGNGLGWKGAFGERPGIVYTTNRKGQLIHKDSPSLITEGAEEITTQKAEDAHYQDDFSDKVKDASFIQTLKWAERNLDKTFYYDYVYGKNWRLSVDQTIGNYQHNKLARALIASGKPVTYLLNNLDHVIRLKAGVMRRFGFDNKNPDQAALKYDEMIDQFVAIKDSPQQILKLASEHEGWASVTSILEAIKIKERLDAPGIMHYTSGFFTEIDGKTNGLGWSSMQAGDKNTAAGAFIFNAEDYAVWAKHYDRIEEFQSAGDLEGLKAFSKDVMGDESFFNRYLDAYNKVNNVMKGKFTGVKSGNFVSYPSMVHDKADAAIKQIMAIAQEAGGPENFRRAIEIFEENKLGRAFTKKPVMIFGYGAGGARHIEQVRAFVNEIIKRDDTGILDKFEKEGIDVDTQFIDPLGAMMSEAININFPVIKTFANMISLAANEAVAQGFDMFPVTLAGHRVPIGGEHWWLSQEKGANRVFSYTHPEHIGKDGVPQIVKGKAHEMKVVWDFSAKKKYYVKKEIEDEDGQTMTVESMQQILRAATQAVVMLNHANDNINMQRGRMLRHDEIIADLMAQAKADGKPFVKDHTTVGDTSLHIFDGDLVTSMEAEATADALNHVFQDMNSRSDQSHIQSIYKVLTFDVDENGELIEDEFADTIVDTPKYKAMNSTNKEKTKYRRRLKPEGVAQAELLKISTWDKMFDGLKDRNGRIIEPSMAFDWDIADEVVGKNVVKHSKSLNQMRIKNVGDKNDFTRGTKLNNFKDGVTNVKQFFYSTKSLEELIKDLKGTLDYMIKKPA